MINKLKKYVSPKFRRKTTRLLPEVVRHRLVDWYISKQASDFEKMYQIKDAKGDLFSSWWKNIHNDGGNNTPDYFAQLEFTGDIDWLKEQINLLLPNKGTVLDFGCNACRVLHCIVEDGYQGVGAEINPEAVEIGKKTFPSLEGVTFHIGDGSESLKEVETQTVDLIYTTHVLRHVAPEKIDEVIAQFSRIAPKYIITLEDEASLGGRTFPHNYRSKFSSQGWRMHSIQYGIDLPDISTTLGGLGVMFRTYTR